MRVRRREFILGLAMLADGGRASAQDRAHRVGVLTNEDFSNARPRLLSYLIVGQVFDKYPTSTPGLPRLVTAGYPTG